MTTIKILQEQLDLINELLKQKWPLEELIINSSRYYPLTTLCGSEEEAVFKALAGDENITFSAIKEI